MSTTHPSRASAPRSREGAFSAEVPHAAAVFAFACVLLTSTPCLAADPSPAQVAQAEDLFQRAKGAMAQRDYAAACPMLAESYQLAPAGGTLQNLAVCYELQGKVAFAYNRFSELRALSLKAGRAERVQLAEARIAALAPRISRLRVALAAASAPGTRVLVDGDEYGEASLRAGIALNVGEHVVQVAAPGKVTATLRAVIATEGTTTTLDVPLLSDAPSRPPALGGASARALLAESREGPTLAELDRVAGKRALRTTGLVVGGVGLAALAAGSVFGVLTITTNNAAKSACRDNTGGSLSTKGDPSGAVYDTGRDFDARGVCYGQTTPWRTANELHDRANLFGTLATVLVPLGLVGLGVGGGLVYTSAKEGARAPSVTATLAPSGNGLVLHGEFQ